MDSPFATQGEWRVIYLMIALFVAVCVLGFIAYPMDWQTRFWRWLKGSLRYHFGRKAMLDRIAELEQDLERSRDADARLFSALKAILRDINIERQRFRSEAAQEIRENIEVVIGFFSRGGNPPIPIDLAVDGWLEVFKSRREKRQRAKKAVLSSRN